MTELVLAVLGFGAGVFAVSAAGKLRGRGVYRDHRAGLRATGLLPERLLPAAAAGLVAFEAVAAVAMAAAAGLMAAGASGAVPLAEAALAIAAALSAVLTAGVAAVVRRGVAAPCACFGARSGRPLSAVHLARNACLLAVLLAGVSCGPFAGGRPAAAASGLALVTGLLAATLVIRWEDLAFLLGPSGAAGTAGPAGRTGPSAAQRPDRTAR